MFIKPKKIVSVATVASIFAFGAGVSIVPAGAVSAPGSSSLDEKVAGWKLNTQDWREIRKSASRAGDKYSAQAASDMIARQPGDVQNYNIATNIAKRAAIAALRYGERKLPAKIAPYAGKIADVIETLNNYEKIPLVSAMMHAGIPYDVADYAADWVLTFLPVP